MSNRYQAGIIRPGYDALKVPNAPTIGTATSNSATSVSVTFTAPSCVGGGAISSYQVFACCGARSAFGASSPLTVTGLTTGTAYTFKAIANNAYGPSFPSAASNSATPTAPIQGQQAYTSAGSYSFVAPANVTFVSAVVIGAGGIGGCHGTCYEGGGGGGGALAYRSNISVTPGNTYAVVVSSTTDSTAFCMSAGNGGNGTAARPGGGVPGGVRGLGGTASGGDVTYSGGPGRTTTSGNGGGGGGAGGYTSSGLASSGSGTTSACVRVGGNSGDGNLGGLSPTGTGGGSGAGTSLLGSGTTLCRPAAVNHGGGVGGSFGGGGGGSGAFCGGGNGGPAGVRIIWGPNRAYPNTNTGDV
jgi:hypothetical protein